jgi:hypothetical protein
MIGAFCSHNMGLDDAGASILLQSTWGRMALHRAVESRPVMAAGMMTGECVGRLITRAVAATAVRDAAAGRRICGKTREGKFQIKRKTRVDRMRAKLKTVQEEMWRRMQCRPILGHSWHSEPRRPDVGEGC